MFNAEHLQEKWAPLLNAEGVDEIKDPHRKAVTAVLLENQEKFLRDEQSFAQQGTITEAGPTNSANAAGASGGFGGSSAAAGPTAGFDPVLISLIRRSMPNLVAYDLAGVQPMSGPTGLIFAMRSRYKSQTGDEAFYDEADSAFSGQNQAFSHTSEGQNGEGDFSNGAVGLGTTVQRGSDPGALDGGTPTEYNVGQGMVTAEAERLGDDVGDSTTSVSYTHLRAHET